MTPLLVTVTEAAQALAISRSKLYQLIASGALDSVRIEGSRRIPMSALHDYIARLSTKEIAA
ncbi:helix-turn-helix domain-containing protein [Microbispora camponoti]|uniref:Helix-turn-helix domain-containing protein n=1 Tax=Microbispora bryophytorum subsp. camponoti TaxID=1677852 RepID=A0ABR8LCV1_9ACTN|nr:helix-turn-helix domain-containing protein [Microbispora camponoti]